MNLNKTVFGYKKNLKKRKKLIRSVEEVINNFKCLPYKFGSVLALYVITIRITQNNIFCYVGDIVTGKTLLKLSSGNIKVNVTKKTLKYHSTRIIPYFFSLLKPKILNTTICVNFVLPKRLKRKIFYLVLAKFKKGRAKKKMLFKLFFFKGKKCFNGCRAPKLKRKKRHKYRILK